jgi:hypothetical protein
MLCVFFFGLEYNHKLLNAPGTVYTSTASTNTSLCGGWRIPSQLGRVAMFYKESLTVDSSGSSCLESARSLVTQLFLLKGFREKSRHVAYIFLQCQ